MHLDWAVYASQVTKTKNDRPEDYNQIIIGLAVLTHFPIECNLLD